MRTSHVAGVVMPAVVTSLEAGRRDHLQVCTVAYTFYESDGRVMRYNSALAARGDMVDVIALREAGQPRVKSVGGVRVTGVQPRRVNERSQLSYLVRILMFFLRAMIVLSWRQLRIGYDVVHIHSVPDFLVFTAWLPKLMGAKVILDIHDLLPELYASKFGVSSDSCIFRSLLVVERISIAFADHLITANDLWHEKLVGRSVKAEKATALVNVPDRSVFRRRGRSRTDDRCIMIYPGTLNWHQGLDIAIEAFAKIRALVPETEFHIYGVGPALPELKKMVERLGLQDCVKFNGFRSLVEIAQIIENADLGVVPKRKDSFGNEAFSTKTLEFMSLGVPVIVSDTKIDKHYFNDSLVRFFESGNVDDLENCMLELIKNRDAREALIRRGLEFVQANSWDVKKKIYLDLVDVLAGAPAESARRVGAAV